MNKKITYHKNNKIVTLELSKDDIIMYLLRDKTICPEMVKEIKMFTTPSTVCIQYNET